MKTLKLIVAVPTILLSAVAFAAPTVPQSTSEPAESPTAELQELFNALDKNKDGYIEASEAKSNAALNKKFKNIAKDGKLDLAGFTKWEASQGKSHPTK